MKQKSPTRTGITLIELLVVISIMMILAAVVLPQLDFGNEKHKNREAARIVATYLSAARNKAIETSRPCGVLFETKKTVDTDGDGIPDKAIASVQMTQVQVPPPYAGDSMASYATVTGTNADFIPNATASINIGDKIQFDYQGPWYEITSVNTAGNTIDTVDFDTTGVPARPWGTTHYPFQIRRQPVSNTGAGNQIIRSMTPPQRMLASTAVDFTGSGFGNTFFDGPDSVAIIFSSNGAVQTVYSPAGNDTPIEPIYLLVGQEMQTPDGPVTGPGPDIDWWADPSIEENDRRPNWQIPESRWVVINPSTGIATVAENMPYDGSVANTQAGMQSAIPVARTIASEGLDGGNR